MLVGLIEVNKNKVTNNVHYKTLVLSMPYSGKAMKIPYLLSIIASVLFSSLHLSLAMDSLSLSQSISDGMTIVSKAEAFEFGFFSPGNSKKRYVGIWYKNIPIQTVVWVANRSSPINDSSGILTVNSTGNLVLIHNNTVVWHTTIQKQAKNPVAQLLDTGNLVIRDENEENPEGYLWQSFDYPTDTLLPGMKFGWDKRIGLNRNLTSWKSPDDPSPGDFSAGMKLNSYPESYIMKGAKKFYRTGPWNGLHISGLPQIVANTLYGFNFISNEDEVYSSYYLIDKSVITRTILNQTTSLYQRFVWVEEEKNWKALMAMPLDYCDSYSLCGVFGTCIITNSPVCKCLKGFKPKSAQAWNSMDWSEGCVRDKPLSCVNNSKDGFMKLEGLKVPDTTNTLVDETIGIEECKIKCLNDCSCMAFTHLNISGRGSGCVMWFGDLIDVREFSIGRQDLYIRFAASELETEYGHKKKLIILVATIMSAIFGILLFGSYYICKVRRNMTTVDQGLKEDMDLPLFDMSTIATSTDNFSNRNKIGEGGFGVVYKGKLVNGQEIAVKRLSKSSRQGIVEFKNEVKLIAKLQHRNLVKLLGCCIQGQEKMLVYEYMPNGSLDCFIFAGGEERADRKEVRIDVSAETKGFSLPFPLHRTTNLLWMVTDDTRGKLLDWPRRFNIICRIARGILYLHQDSRLRIIHRDLKASNVLLDDKLNPKISDFGMARLMGVDQIDGNTNKIVGTFGYIAPEYAANGRFSVKSDVFSFGILLLEIICGKRNRDFYHPNDTNLIGHAWKLWKDERAIELVDTNMMNSCIVSELLHCIHVGLLCVQQFPEDRPTMTSVVQMLGGENELIEPKLPGFFPRRDLAEANSSPIEAGSSNEISISLLEPR